MMPQEREMIDGLIKRIRSTQVTDKDTEAEQHLQQGLAGYADALYVLAQTVLVQQYGLNQAQQQIQQLQAALDEARQHASQHGSQSGGGSFLSKLFGGGSSSNQQQSSAQGYSAQQQPYQPVNNPGYAPPTPYAQPGYGYGTGYGQPVGYAPGGGGGFLRSAMQTAAGVAAGEMMFQGMESLFHGFGGGGGYGEGRPTEIVNNYYEGGDRPEHHAADTDSGFYNPEHDASRDLTGDQGSAQGFADTGSTDDAGYDSGFDDSGTDDFTSSDDGSLDDGGGFDDSGSDFGGGDDSGF